MIQARVFGGYPGLFTPESFVKASVRTVMSLLKHLTRLNYERDYPHAQTTLYIAKTMGGYKGDDVNDFLPPWSQPGSARRRVPWGKSVDASIKAAFGLNLVSQDVLDHLVLAGYEP